MRVYALLLLIILTTACAGLQPPADKQGFNFGLDELGKSFAELQSAYQLKPPVSGFNQGRYLSVSNRPHQFEDMTFEVVFVFDQPGEQGRLRAVENIYRPGDSQPAPTSLPHLIDYFNRMWGEPQTASRLNSWRWQGNEIIVSLSTEDRLWVLEVHQDVSGALQDARPLATLGGWDQALYGNTLESLSKTYNLDKVERSRLNNKPVSALQNEVQYLGNQFQVSFFFDRFTPQASLVGVDLYLLRETDPGQWVEQRDRLIESLSKLYRQPRFRREGHRQIWVWKDMEGSLTLTDASRGGRSTWLLGFRPPPGKVEPTPALAAPRSPQDIAGWGNARFGMSPAQIELMYTGHSPGLQRLAGSGYGFESSLQLDDLDFRVLFLFDRSQRPAKLRQIVVSRQAPEEESAGQSKTRLRELMNLLTAWYGVPTQDNLRGNGGKAVWKRPSGSLELYDLQEIKTWVLNFRGQ